MGGTNLWTIISNVITNNGTMASVAVPVSGPNALFRLWNPSLQGLGMPDGLWRDGRSALFDRRPDAVNIIVVIQALQKFTDFRPLRRGKFRMRFRQIARLAGHHRPTVL